MEVVEDTRIRSSCSDSTPPLNTVEALAMAAIDGKNHFDCVIFLPWNTLSIR
jgi:hypothetical protein